MQRLSPQTRTAFRETFVSWTVLGQIRDWFDSEGIPLQDLPANRLPSGQRRTLVEQYYAGVDWQSAKDVRHVLNVYEQLLGIVEEQDESAFRKLVALLQRDGYSVSEGIIHASGTLDVDAIIEAAEVIDIRHIQPHLNRIADSVDADPAQAIGSSKELLETVSKAILHELGDDFDQFNTLQQLVKAAFKSLDLATEDIPDAKKGADSIRKVLAGLSQIVHGVAELRNQYGTGHGRLENERGITSRHARLVAGSVSTLVTFMLETFSTRQALREKNAETNST